MTIIGYARVSTDGQSLQSQTEALHAAGASKVYSEKQSGVRTDRPQLAKAIAALADGDTLVVCKLDRLARSNSNIFLGVEDGTADITSVTYLTFISNPFALQETAINQMTIEPSPTPVRAALPLFATGLGGLGLLGWRRKREARVARLIMPQIAPKRIPLSVRCDGNAPRCRHTWLRLSLHADYRLAVVVSPAVRELCFA